MKLLYYLFEKFIEEEWFNISCIIILSIALSIFATNVISSITANIIQSINNGTNAEVYLYYKLFVVITVIFVSILYIYKYFQTIFLSKLPEWIKQEILEIILKFNNINMSNTNFVNFYNHITRISASGFITFNDIIGTYIPSLAFILVIAGYFLYKNSTLGLMFLFFNALIVIYLSYFIRDIIDEKRKQEIKVGQLNSYMLDLLNNIDKVIYRGQTKVEIDIFQKKTDEVIQITNNYLVYMNNHMFMANSFSYLNIFSILGYLIYLQSKKLLSTTTFITFFTITLLYRDRISNVIYGIPDNVESVGRIMNMISEFDAAFTNDVSIKQMLKDLIVTTNPSENKVLTFDKIRFEDVSFKYKGTDIQIYDHFSKEIYLKNKIIGIVGLSGKGKSTLMKLVLRLYEPTSGNIYIDDVNISTLDPDFIREHITYVNQNSRLFDKKVLENIFYGCKHEESCDKHLKEIMEYSKIKELFKNVDIVNGPSGALGEKLSGGQRQVVNIISGLINPTEILVLDEPTNALDNDLKNEVLAILQKFRKYKKCIMIITHDHDVYPLFDETIEL